MTKTKIKHAGKLTENTLERLQKHIKTRRKNENIRTVCGVKEL